MNDKQISGTGGRVALGRWGERVAALHLEAHGYTIIGRNWRCPAGEVDLIARKGERLAFVEVKTRRGTGAGSAEEAFTPRKAARMQTVALHWLGLYAGDEEGECEIGLDLVAVTLDSRGVLLHCNHLENAGVLW